MGDKRIRGKNFTEREKNMLFELVTADFKSVIENKESDAITVAKKNLAWQEIAQSYNAQCETGHRTAKQLHALYDNMKKTARSNLYSDKKSSYKTGGGTFVPKSTALDAKIVTVLKDQFQPLQNKFDSSASYIEGQPKPSCSGFNMTEKYNIEDCSLESADALSDDTPNTPGRVEVTRTSPTESVASATPSPPPQQPVKGRTAQKRKFQMQSVQVPKKRSTCAETISNRFVRRKNYKDMQDAEVQKLKIDILNIEKELKLKQLAVVQQQLDNDRKLFELNFQHRVEEISFE
ncbi:hypothetical protein Zmor_003731 [Zophobas morio]|nr:hypothetical protein Zmor_003731 [Zophobas morio]